MTRSKQIILLWAGTAALAVGVWLGFSAFRHSAEPPLVISGIYFAEPKAVEDFVLTAQDGRPFTRHDLEGRWSFLYFGYTHCPDACPLTLTQLNLVQRSLTQQGLDGDTSYYFVSVDPRRDTPERLGKYAAYFNPKFRGVTGNSRELSHLAKQFGIFFQLNDQQDQVNYTVDHSSVVVLTDPQARLRAVFTHPDQAGTMVDDFIAIRSRYRPS